MATAKAAHNLGVKVVTALWAPPFSSISTPSPDQRRDDRRGFREVVDTWTPIFDEFDKYGVKFALEVHPAKSPLITTPSSGF